MDAIKKAIGELSLEEWNILYRWAIREESVRREKEAIREELIREILSGVDNDTPVDQPSEPSDGLPDDSGVNTPDKGSEASEGDTDDDSA